MIVMRFLPVNSSLKRLQPVRNAAAKILARANKPALKTLYIHFWLFNPLLFGPVLEVFTPKNVYKFQKQAIKSEETFQAVPPRLSNALTLSLQQIDSTECF